MISSVEHMIHFVCLNCRRSVKGKQGYEWKKGETDWTTVSYPSKCSQCGGEMPCVGKWFTPPRRRDDKQWKKLAWMISQGWPRANWQTKPEMSLREVRETEPERVDPSAKRLLLWNQQHAAQAKIQKRQRHRAHNAHKKKRRAEKEWQRQLAFQARFESEGKQ